MHRYAVAGNPVEHSQSPFIHAQFAAQTGEPVVYDRLLCPTDAFLPTVQAFAQGGASGCNVTVPFKFEAFAAAARTTPRAQLAEAANVLRFDAEGWWADNTDGIGLVVDIEHHAGRPLAGRRVLMVGAGGAAAGALGPLLAARPALLVVANRSPDRARTLVHRHRHVAEESGSDLQAHGLADCGTDFDIVINATASSLGGQGAPVHERVLARGALALDMMYGPAAAPFIAWAERHGAIGRDGLGMLVEQAAASFEFWRSVRPTTPPVLAALRARLTAPTP